MNNRLTSFCIDKGLISYNQIGFRKGFRTSDHIFTLKTLIDKSLCNNQKLYACFVDFKKAYDTVWRKGLLYKLLKMGISMKFVNLLKSMYSELKFCVSLENGLSLPVKSQVGLKQGCSLSPLLFNIFINDLPGIIDNINCNPPLLGDHPVSCLLYADDLVLLSNSKEGLQNSLNALNEYSTKWFLEVNEVKTKCLVFSKGRQPRLSQFWLGKTRLQFCEEYCYLGIIFSRSGNFKAAVKALTEKANGAMFSIVRNLYKHRSIDHRVMLDIFDKMVLPIALYGVQIWGVNFLPQNKYNKDFFDRTILAKHDTENVQYRFLTILLGVTRRSSSWAVASEFGRYPIIIKAFKTMCSFFNHLLVSESPIIEASLEENKILSEQGKNTWYNSIKKSVTLEILL